MRTLPFDYAIRNLGRSPLRLLLSVSGAMLVVLLVIAAAAFINGMQKSLSVSASPNNWIFLGIGSEESVERSEIDSRTATIVAASVDGIATELNTPFVSPEVHLALKLSVAEGEEGSLGVIRGVTPSAFLVHPQVRMIEGRLPEPGMDEVIVGRLAAAKLGVEDASLQVGSSMWFDGRPWTVSGRFEAPNTVMDAEVWCPLTDVQIAAQRDSLSCVVISLDPETGKESAVRAFAAQRLDLELAALKEDTYYKQLTEFFGPIRAMVLLTAALVAGGAFLGGLNTMYAAFASRIRELGSLQVLGYSRTSIAWSMLQESMLASTAGAIIAAGVGLLVIDGVAIRFSMGAFGLVVDGPVLAIGLASGVVMGVVGAALPTWRCLRVPIAESLKSA